MDDIYYSDIDWTKIVVNDISIHSGKYENYNIEIWKKYVQVDKDNLITLLTQFMISDLGKIVSDYLMIKMNIIICPMFDYYLDFDDSYWIYYIVNIKNNNDRIRFEYSHITNILLRTYGNVNSDFINDYIHIANNHVKYLTNIGFFKANPLKFP